MYIVCGGNMKKKETFTLDTVYDDGDCYEVLKKIYYWLTGVIESKETIISSHDADVLKEVMWGYSRIVNRHLVDEDSK
jgi:hypothetical protein